MKKTLIVAVVIVLNWTLFGFAQQGPSSSVYKVVVDRTTRNKVLNDYVLVTRDAIQQAWRTPLDLGGSSAVKGRVRINYTVTRNGTLEQVELVEGSGNAEMDRSLMAAIRSAQPFPPFSDGINAGRVMIRANFIIADLPTVGVTRVSQPASPKQRRRLAAADKPDRAAPSPEKKRGSLASPDSTRNLLWGRPAGTGDEKKKRSLDKPKAVPTTPSAPTRKYRWGAQ